jgi:small subunit ribosomal protein S20
MPTSKSAMKTIITSEKARIRNKATRTALRSAEKKYRSLVDAVELDKAKEQLNDVFKKLDKAVKAGTIHRKKSDRKKSRLSTILTKKA